MEEDMKMLFHEDRQSYYNSSIAQSLDIYIWRDSFYAHNAIMWTDYFAPIQGEEWNRRNMKKYADTKGAGDYSQHPSNGETETSCWDSTLTR